MNALVRQIAVLSVLWAVCELLLPDGKHQHMVRMTASLLVMTALFSTVSGWLGGAQNAQPAMTAVVQQAAEDTYRRTALTAIANQIQNHCVHLAERAGYHADAVVYLQLDGQLDHIQLTLDEPAYPLLTTNALASLLAQQLSISEQEIRLSMEGT